MVGGGQKRKAANQQPVCGHVTDESRRRLNPQTQTMTALKKELERVKARLKTADEELREYLRISLISKDKEIESVNKDMLLIQSKNRDLLAEKASFEESKKELEANQSELMESHSKMSSTLSALKKELYDLKNNNSQLSATNSKLQHEAEQNTEKITQLQKDQLEYEKSNKLLSDQIRDERMTLEICQEKYSALDKTRQAEEKTVQDMMSTFKSLQCGIKELETSILEKEKEINEREKADSKLSTDYDSLLIKYNKNEDNNSALRVENQSLQESMLIKNEQINTLRKSKEELESSIKLLKDAEHESSAAYASLQEKYNTLEKDSKETNESLRKASGIWKEKYNDIKRTYEDRTSIEKDKQIGNASTILQENKKKIKQLLKDHKLIEQTYKESKHSLEQSILKKNEVITNWQEKQTALDQTCKSLQQTSLVKDEQIRKAKAEAESRRHEIQIKDDQYGTLYGAYGELFAQCHSLKNRYSQLLHSHSTLQRYIEHEKEKTKKTHTNNGPQIVHSPKILNPPKLTVDDIKFSPINRPPTHKGDFTLNENDVLLGPHNHEYSGNKQLRRIAQSRLSEYQEASKGEKGDISRDILYQIQTMEPPGRFLCMNTLTFNWDVVASNIAREKVCQTLRDAVATEIRHAAINSSVLTPRKDNDDALSYKAEVTSNKESAEVEILEEEEESVVGYDNTSAMAPSCTQVYMLGTKVSKMFFDEKRGEMRLYDGAIKSYDPKTMYYKVVYDEDGDSEDLFASGVKEILVE